MTSMFSHRLDWQLIHMNLLYFGLPIDGPPLNLLGAPFNRTWKGPILPWFNRFGGKLQLSFVLEHLIEDLNWFFDVCEHFNFSEFNVWTEQFKWHPSKLQFPLYIYIFFYINAIFYRSVLVMTYVTMFRKNKPLLNLNLYLIILI